MIPSTSHMILYSDVTALDLAARAAGRWFTRTLLELPTTDNQVGQFG